MIVKAKCTILS